MKINIPDLERFFSVFKWGFVFALIILTNIFDDELKAASPWPNNPKDPPAIVGNALTNLYLEKVNESFEKFDTRVRDLEIDNVSQISGLSRINGNSGLIRQTQTALTKLTAEVKSISDIVDKMQEREYARLTRGK